VHAVRAAKYLYSTAVRVHGRRQMYTFHRYRYSYVTICFHTRRRGNVHPRRCARCRQVPIPDRNRPVCTSTSEIRAVGAGARGGGGGAAAEQQSGS
jgi:hypothetical protein